MRSYLILFGIALSTLAFFGGMSSKIPIIGSILEPENYYAKQAALQIESENVLYVYEEAFQYIVPHLKGTSKQEIVDSSAYCGNQLRLVITGSNLDLARANPKTTPIWLTCNGKSGKQVAELEELKTSVSEQIESTTTGWSIFAHIIAMILFVLAMFV
ncbi:hypothetical protein MA790_004726 [Vibrio parahaemolyticus]|nr:hypothetical protein [Vibrio parahaemolyticus]